MKKNNFLVGKSFKVNISIENWYKKQLINLVKQMTQQYNKDIINIFREDKEQINIKVDKEIIITEDQSISSQMRIKLNNLKNKYETLYNRKSKIIVKYFLKKNLKYSFFTFQKTIKNMINNKDFTLKTKYITEELKEKVKAMIYENVNLIKSIHQKYFEEIQGTVMRSINNGKGLNWLSKQIEKYGTITKRRARNIASDQTRKVYNNIQLSNMQANGIKYFRWLHSGGGKRPRKYHKEVLNNQIFSIENLPIIDENTKEKGFPGQLPYCRCTMVPIIQIQ